MAKNLTAALEETYHDAFNFAQERRKLMGLAPLKADLHIVKRGASKGATRVGPIKYKITYWATPAAYADLLRLREILKLSSPTAVLERLIMEAMPPRQRHTRPEPVASVAERVGLRRAQARGVAA